MNDPTIHCAYCGCVVRATGWHVCVELEVVGEWRRWRTGWRDGETGTFSQNADEVLGPADKPEPEPVPHRLDPGEFGRVE